MTKSIFGAKYSNDNLDFFFIPPGGGGGGYIILDSLLSLGNGFLWITFQRFISKKNIYFPGEKQMYFSDVYGLPIAVFNFSKIEIKIRPTCARLFLNSHLVFPLLFRVPNIVIIYVLYCIQYTSIYTHYPCTRPCYLFPTLL